MINASRWRSMKPVSTAPGDTDSTRMFGPSTRASDFVMVSIAAFEAPYAILLPPLLVLVFVAMMASESHYTIFTRLAFLGGAGP